MNNQPLPEPTKCPNPACGYVEASISCHLCKTPKVSWLQQIADAEEKL